jgi:DNA polymerase III epsilon subunit-like protein
MSNKLIFVDVETGGLDPNVHSILSIGMVLWGDFHIVAEKEWYVKEDPIAVTSEAMEVNNIDLKSLQDPPSQVVKYISMFLNKHGFDPETDHLAGHNVGSFDCGFIKRLYRLADQPFPFKHRVVDTFSTAKALQLCNGLPDNLSLSLESLCKYYDVKYAAHNALSDAHASAIIFEEILKDL